MKRSRRQTEALEAAVKKHDGRLVSCGVDHERRAYREYRIYGPFTDNPPELTKAQQAYEATVRG